MFWQSCAIERPPATLLHSASAHACRAFATTMCIGEFDTDPLPGVAFGACTRNLHPRLALFVARGGVGGAQARRNVHNLPGNLVLLCMHRFHHLSLAPFILKHVTRATTVAVECSASRYFRTEIRRHRTNLACSSHAFVWFKLDQAKEPAPPPLLFPPRCRCRCRCRCCCWLSGTFQAPHCAASLRGPLLGCLRWLAAC